MLKLIQFLDIGSKSVHNYEVNYNQESPSNQNDHRKIQSEITRIENEVELFKEELVSTFQAKFEKEKFSMKKVN